MWRTCKETWIVGAISAVILLAILTRDAAAQGRTGPAPAPKNWKIAVGPGACDLNENSQPASTQALSKLRQHKIDWNSTVGQSLSIVVHVPANCPAPFKKMTKIGAGLWAVECKNGICSSGPPANGACERDYKYDQILGDKRCDGWIIIQP